MMMLVTRQEKWITGCTQGTFGNWGRSAVRLATQMLFWLVYLGLWSLLGCNTPHLTRPHLFNQTKPYNTFLIVPIIRN